MTFILRFSFLMFMICSIAGGALAADVQGQKPVMFVGDTFQFVPGAWASYYIYDKTKNEHYVMQMATLERGKQDGKQCSWMEIEVLPESGPAVVTRMLTEETKQGPGALLDVIVQVKGYSPFTVPKKYYEGENKEVGEFAGPGSPGKSCGGPLICRAGVSPRGRWKQPTTGGISLRRW